MRIPIIAGNWKMNMTNSECKNLIEELIPLSAGKSCEIVICPPYTDIRIAAELTAGTIIKVGAQNIHWAEKGAFTGEISADMLKEAGAEYAIIGHSERRQYFNETDDTVNKKVKAALNAGIIPIVCVGESLEQRECGETTEVVATQTAAALSEIPLEFVEQLIIAYEPIWAIGTGRTATSKQADETVKVIRNTIKNLCGQSTASNVRILYGGSMNPQNADELISMPNIDGGLIGGASLKPQDFAQIIDAASRNARKIS